MKNSAQNILIIQTAFIGDVVLATSFVSSVKKKYPSSSIHFLLRKGNESLLKNNPHINRIWTWDKTNKKYRNLFKTITELRTYYFEYTFNIQRFFSTGLITVLIKSRHKVGFHKNPLSPFFSKKIKHQIPHQLSNKEFLHEIQRNHQLLDNNIPPTDDIRPQLYLTENDKKAVAHYIIEGDYLVIAPSSVWFTKQWALEKWQELVDELSKKFLIYLIGALKDYQFCEAVKNNNDKVINLCGKLNLLASAALMEKAKRVFVNDSAPLHLASSVNAPTTAIFCSTLTDFGYYPLSKNSNVIQVRDLDCRPCGLHGKKACPLKHFRCAKDIQTQQVTKTIL